MTECRTRSLCKCRTQGTDGVCNATGLNMCHRAVRAGQMAKIVDNGALLGGDQQQPEA